MTGEIWNPALFTLGVGVGVLYATPAIAVAWWLGWSRWTPRSGWERSSGWKEEPND